MTNSEKKNKSGMPTFLILLMIIAATGFWYVVIYGDIDIFNIDDRMTIQASGNDFVSNTQTNATKIDLFVDTEVADFTLQTQVDMGDDLIQAYWDYSVRAKTDPPFIVDLDFYSENDTLYYTVIIVQNNDEMFISISEFDVLILISKTISQLDISLQHEVGSVDLDLNQMLP